MTGHPTHPEPTGPTPGAPPRTTPKRATLSVVTVCKNNEKTIAPVLDSVRGLADEIVAIDSGSTDGTIALLRAHGAAVIEREWAGYVGTKQIALGSARCDWVLHLDSDEPVTPELARSIRDLLERDDPAVVAARVRRVVWYRGEPMKHAWQPEWRLRLVRRSLVESGAAKWGGTDPHDVLRVDRDSGAAGGRAGGRVVDLDGVLRHDSFVTFSDHFAKQVGHARTAAVAIHAKGGRTNLWRLMTSPPGAFLKQIVLKQAWRDGAAGWLAASTAALGALAKHAILLEMAQPGTAKNMPADRSSAYREGSERSPGTRGRNEADAAHPCQEPAGRPDTPSEAALSEDTVDAGTGSVDDQDHREPKPTGSEPASDEGQPKKKRRRRRRRRKSEDGVDAEGGKAASAATADDHDDRANASDDENTDDDRPVSKGLRNVTPLSEEAKQHVFNLERSFRDLGLNDELVRALDDAGWEYPTKIQAELIPPVLEGKHILGQAKTGSGKTAAFGLPVLHRAEKGVAMQTIILAPTRELAVQIRDDIDNLAKYTGLKSCAVYGGQKISTQADRLARGPEIIVGTPGRVLDMIERRILRLDGVRMAVLDEVDRMLDIGFRDDIRRILQMCPKDKQTVFVSATLSDEIERLARTHMRDPVRLIVTSGSLTVEMVTQHHMSVNAWDKKRMLAHMLTHEEPDLTIVFCRMKRTVDDVVRYLGKKNIHAHALHGDMSQGKRNETMRNFRHGELNVLVASDLASRGLDVDGITHVVNYDLPDDPDVYVHRIGRTARAGREGIAWSLVTPEQGGLLTEIEVLINAEIPERKYDDFEPGNKPDNWRPEPTGGRPPVEVKGVEAAKSRLKEEDNLPAADKLSKAELAAKFPGGVVPKKMPGKRMRGKLKTRGR